MPTAVSCTYPSINSCAHTQTCTRTCTHMHARTHTHIHTPTHDKLQEAGLASFSPNTSYDGQMPKAACLVAPELLCCLCNPPRQAPQPPPAPSCASPPSACASGPEQPLQPAQPTVRPCPPTRTRSTSDPSVNTCTLARSVNVAVPQARQSGLGGSGLLGPSRRFEEGCSLRYVLRSADAAPARWGA